MKIIVTVFSNSERIAAKIVSKGESTGSTEQVILDISNRDKKIGLDAQNREMKKQKLSNEKEEYVSCDRCDEIATLVAITIPQKHFGMHDMVLHLCAHCIAGLIHWCGQI